MIKRSARFFRGLLSFTSMDVASAMVNGGFSLLVMTIKNYFVLGYGLEASLVASAIMGIVKFSTGFFAMKPQRYIDERIPQGAAHAVTTAVFYAIYQTLIFSAVIAFKEPLHTLIPAARLTFILSLVIGPWVVSRVKELGKWLSKRR